MPEVDGCEVARRLRCEVEGIFLIAMSGHALDQFPAAAPLFHIAFVKGQEPHGLQHMLKLLAQRVANSEAGATLDRTPRIQRERE